MAYLTSLYQLFNQLTFHPTFIYVQYSVACFLKFTFHLSIAICTQLYGFKYSCLILEIWGVRYILSLPLLPGPLWPGVVIPITVPNMSQIDLFKSYLY